MPWIFQIGRSHLNNTALEAPQGSDPCFAHSTPLAVGQGYSPNVAKPNILYQGGEPLSNGQRPVIVSYGNVNETIPLAVNGAHADNLAQILQPLTLDLSSASTRTPIVWRQRPHGATNEVFTEVYGGSIQPRATDNKLSPQEGWAEVDAEVVLVRAPFFASDTLVTLINGATATNDGTLISLGTLTGDMIHEGSPLNFTIAKPASQSAVSALLATVASRLAATISQSKTTASTTTGLDYSASGDLDISVLRTRRDLSLRILARLTTLTAPTTAQMRVTVQTSAGNTLWVGPWTRLGSNTTAQLVDLGDTTLDALRTPLSGTVNVKLLATIRSTDGTSVTATLDYLHALLIHDFCIATAASGLGASQSYKLFGAQNLSGGGWQPMIPEGAAVVGASNARIKGALIQGQLPRGFEGASLYIAWMDAGGAHTKTDTAVVTVEHAPLWRTLRGLS